MHLTPTEWLLGACAALCVGLSKTGIPGVGILVVPLMASLFGGRLSVGTLLPMLLFADCFAVAWYRKYTQWDKLRQLLPWVLVGLAGGAGLLWWIGESRSQKDSMNLLIGLMVLAMLGVHVLRQRLGEQLRLTAPWAIAATGSAAGFATTVSNAAGPVMGIYLTGIGMPKEQFMGTTAWYFLLINLSKVPVYLLLTLHQPARPFATVLSLQFVLALCPMILLGVFVGRWALPRIPQSQFDALVLTLAAASAIKLIFS